MIKDIILLVATILIYIAVHVGRKDESKIELFDKNWWISIILITLGLIMIVNSNNIIEFVTF